MNSLSTISALPDWMLAHDLNELKDKLGGVIILVMVVKFLEHLVEWEDPQGSLFFAIAVAVVSIPRNGWLNISAGKIEIIYRRTQHALDR